MKMRYFLGILVVILMCSACTRAEPQPTYAPSTTTVPTAATTIAPTEPPETQTDTPLTAPAEVTTEPPVVFAPYLTKISRADFPIYRGPGYDTGLTRYVETAGTFTIVEETQDDRGNLWGRLKSGAGWVDLTRLAMEEARGPVVCLEPIDDYLLMHGDYKTCSIAFDPYGRLIMFKANTTVTQVEIFSLLFAETTEESEPLYTQDVWEEGTLLLLEASFPGDMSAYGIRVTDSDGVTYRYVLWENLSGEGEPFWLNTYAPELHS